MHRLPDFSAHLTARAAFFRDIFGSRVLFVVIVICFNVGSGNVGSGSVGSGSVCSDSVRRGGYRENGSVCSAGAQYICAVEGGEGESLTDFSASQSMPSEASSSTPMFATAAAFGGVAAQGFEAGGRRASFGVEMGTLRRASGSGHLLGKGGWESDGAG